MNKGLRLYKDEALIFLTALYNVKGTVPLTFKINKKAVELESDILNYGYQDHKTHRWKINAQKDPFKALKITDTFIPSENSIVKKVEIIKKTTDGKFDITGLEGMKIFAEFLKKDIEAEVEVRLCRYYKDPGNIGERISIDQMINSCKAFYSKVLKHETENFFKGFDKDIGRSRISELYNEFLDLNESPNSFLLRIGKHSGRNSLSFNLLNKKGREPKSRKLIIEGNEYLPLGWLYITDVT